MNQLSVFAGLSLLVALFQFLFVLVLLHENRVHTRKLAYLLCALLVFSLGSMVISFSWSTFLTAIAKHFRFLSVIFIPFLLYGYLQQFSDATKKWNLLIPGILLGFSIAILIVTIVVHYHFSSVLQAMEDNAKYIIMKEYPSVFRFIFTAIQSLTILISLYSLLHAVTYKASTQKKRILLVILGVLLFGITLLSMISFMSVPFQECFLLILQVFSTGLILLLYSSEALDTNHDKHVTLMFETLQDGVLLLGKDQRILNISSKAKEYMHDLDDSFLGKTLAQASLTVALLQAYIQQQSCVEKTTQGLILQLPQDGNTTSYYEIRQFSAAKAPFSFLIIRDMTECCNLKHSIEESNEQLSRANQLKSMLIEIMAHDLRSPFVAMKSMQQLLTASAMTKDSLLWEQTNAELDSLIDRASSLLNNLLALSIIADAKQSYPITIVDVQTILDGIPKAVKQSAMQKGVQLFTHIEDNALVHANAYLSSTALRNILENAIKYSPKAQAIHLSVSIQPKTVLITIDNTGEPIGEDVLTAFSQDRWGVCTVGTAGEKGPGLGLYAAKQFLHYMGGGLSLQNRSPVGTRVEVQMKRAFPSEWRYQQA